jgi:hypothetical protein
MSFPPDRRESLRGRDALARKASHGKAVISSCGTLNQPAVMLRLAETVKTTKRE